MVGVGGVGGSYKDAAIVMITSGGRLRWWAGAVRLDYQWSVALWSCIIRFLFFYQFFKEGRRHVLFLLFLLLPQADQMKTVP